MKQLILGHFNTNRKIFTVTVFFFSRKNKKTAPKGPILVCLVYKEFSAISRQFPIISEDFRRLPKDFRRLKKMTKICYGPFEQRLKKSSWVILEQIRTSNAKNLEYGFFTNKKNSPTT